MTYLRKTAILLALLAVAFLGACQPACPTPPPPIESCDPLPNMPCTPEHP